MNPPSHDLDQRLLQYADRILRLVDRLPSTRAGNHVAGQLLRAGTAPLPMHGTVPATESKEDLLARLRSCLKDLQESRRWLCFIKHVPLIQPVDEVDVLLAETESLIGLFATSVWAARRKSALRWQLRQPRRRVRRSVPSRLWLSAKSAVNRVWQPAKPLYRLAG